MLRWFRNWSCESVDDGGSHAVSKRLCDAAHRGHVGIIRSMIDEAIADEGETGVMIRPSVAISALMLRRPLFLACHNGHCDVAALLIAHAADVNRICDFSRPLVVAARNGHCAVVALLLASHADVDPDPACGCTPLYEAVKCGHASIASALIQARATLTPRLLVAAAATGRVEISSLLLAARMSPNDADDEGATPLCAAVRSGYPAVVSAARRKRRRQ